MTDLLSEAALLAEFTRPWTLAFRYEGRPFYDVTSDRNTAGVSDFDRWRDGAEHPDAARKAAVLAGIRAEEAAGQHTQRVRHISAPPTDYERFACEWGYAYNERAGEEVWIWDAGDGQTPWPGLDDFWILDPDNPERARVMVMAYDDAGRFLGWRRGELIRRYRIIRTGLLAGSMRFHPWWERRTDLHRRLAA